jgi:hypothetical protein
MEEDKMKRCHSNLFRGWVVGHFRTIAHFSEVLGISKPTATKYINDPYLLTLRHIQVLAKVAKVDKSELINHIYDHI